MLSSKENDALNALANDIGVSSKKLYQLINFESKWNPQAKNPFSSARGLLQFTDATSQSLGYIDSMDLVTKNPNITSQLLGPVKSYLSFFRPYYTEQSLAMAVFYPAYRYVPINTVFPENVRKVNPSIVTVEDYMKKVFPGFVNKNIPIILIILSTGIILFMTSKKGKG